MTDFRNPREETLDPEDWQAFRELAHQMVDDTIDYLSSLQNRPAWRPMPDSVNHTLNEPLPQEGEGMEAVYETFKQQILPYPSGNLHPRFFGWVQGNGTPLGMMAEMLGAAINPHLAGFNQAPALVEHQVIKWLAELMGMPADASGVLVTGGSMANLLGIAVGRFAKAEFNIREEGLQQNRANMVLYGSTETHGWAQKTSELLGHGNSAFRKISADENFQIKLPELRERIRKDRSEGLQPYCIIATAGTVNTGATDDLEAISEICREENMWFHIDGAFGAMIMLSEKYRDIAKGIEKADSIAFDLHKWGYLPYDVGCILVRDKKLHQDTFSISPAYLAEFKRGVIAGGLPFSERGIDLTRGFKALKVWMSFKAHGVQKIGRIIGQNVEQAQYLKSVVEADENLELLAPVPLNIVCFRFNPANRPSLDDDALNDLNQEILLRMQERGIAVPSSTMIRGRYAIRVCNVNHRSRFQDVRLVASAAVELGTEILSEAKVKGPS